MHPGAMGKGKEQPPEWDTAPAIVLVDFNGPYATSGELRAARQHLAYQPKDRALRIGCRIGCLDVEGNYCEGEVVAMLQGWQGEYLQIKLHRHTWEGS